MQQRSAGIVAEAGHQSNGWILIVDDDAFSRDLLVRRLNRAGYGTAASADARQALVLLDKYPFSLVLLDVVMPGIDGRELLTRIRERFGPSSLPVIMVTSQTESQVISDCFRRGASD
jgi:two-component system sensor histidine kinase ChiS